MEAVREAKIPDGALPRICISGCPSSCSGHQAAALGFQGAAKTVDGKPESAFKMFVGGSDKLGAAKFGEAGAVILERDLPKFFVELGKAVASRNMNWETWIAGHEDEFCLLYTSGFHLHALACRETRVLDLLGRGRCRGKRLRLKCQSPVRRSRLFSVDRKGQGLSLGIALDVDRSICLLYTSILAALWIISGAYEQGISFELRKIPVAQETFPR